MEYVATLIFRNGKHLERAQLHGRDYRGRFEMHWCEDRVLGRVKRARLVEEGGSKDVVPPLLDADVLEAAYDRMVVRGQVWITGKAGTEHAVLQEWHMVAVSSYDLQRAESMCNRLSAELHRYREKYGPLPEDETPKANR